MKRRGLGVRIRRHRQPAPEVAASVAEEKAAAQRVALLFGLCPECFDDLPLKGTHACAAR